MKTFDVLSPDLDVMGFHFLEASAGTGKTFAIEHLVVRWLLEGIPLERILMVTFTRASTRELRLRVRNNIAKALEHLKAKETRFEYLVTASESAIGLLEDALTCFDDAQIFTIHGFCYRKLSEWGFLAGAPLLLHDPDQGNNPRLAHEVVCEILKYHLKSPEYAPIQLEILLKHCKNRLKQHLAKLVLQTKEIRVLPSNEELWKRWEQALQEIPTVSSQKFQATYEIQRPSFKDMNNSDFCEQVMKLGQMLEARSCSLSEWEEMLGWEEFFLENLLPNNLKKRSHWTLSIEFTEVQKTLLPLWKEARNPRKIMLRIAKAGQELYRKKDINKSSPDQLLKEMERCVGFPLFVQHVKEQYDAAVIDEFQDTDPMQWTIFKSLFIENPIRAVCLVGDPKQSIYAFREADLYTYLTAADALGSAAKKSLNTNFRSTPELVDALNRLFTSSRVAGFLKLPAFQTALEIPSVKAGLAISASLSVERGAVHFFVVHGEKVKKNGKWPSNQLETQAIFPFIAREILNLGDVGKCAVLVKDRFQAQRLLEHLQQQGIPAMLRKSVALVECTGWAVMEELLDAIESPTHLGHLKRLLAGPLVGWSLDQIEGGSLHQVQVRLLQLQAILHKEGFFPFFQAVLASFWGTGRTDLHIELEQIAEEIAATGKPASRQLLQALKEEAELSEELLKKRVAEEGNAVQILTTHMSKGLEFDIVFALGIACRSKLHDAIVVKKEIAPLDEDSEECRNALLELDAEKMRQLYVALTRAKKRVYVPIVLEEKAGSLPHGVASPLELFLEPVLKEIDLSLFIQELGGSISLSEEPLIGEKLEIQPLPAEKLSNFLTPQLNIDAQWIGSFTSLAKPMDKEALPPLASTDEKQIDNMPLGAETGVILHRIMETILIQSAHHPLLTEKIAQMVEREVAHTGLREWADPISQAIEEVLQDPFIDGWSLSQIPSSQMRVEMEFLYQQQGDPAWIKGFIDLFLKAGDKYYLLDWKTNFLDCYTDEKIAESIRQCDYELQAAIYTQALERYVKLFDKRPFSECFGGTFYIYLRGKKPFPVRGGRDLHFRPVFSNSAPRAEDPHLI